MKKNIIIIVVMLLAFSVKSQTKSLYEDEYAIKDAYYKDLYNDLDRYIGTWKYTSGSISLTIILQKKLRQHVLDEVYDFYEDVLVGEYMYVENGIVKANTLSQLNLNLNLEANKYNIVGNIIAGPNSPYCLNCGPNDRKVLLQFIDPDREIPGYESEMIFQRADDATVEKLKLKFRTISGLIAEVGVEPEFTEYTIPFGEYVLTKVN